MTAGRKNADTLSKDWGTPHKYVEAVRNVFGGAIELDPCSNRWSVVKAKTEWSLPKTDGLKERWSYRTIYVNPPYGRDRKRNTRISDWLKKCADAGEDYGSEVIALVPVAANTLHWKLWVWARATAICFLYDTRLMFLENGRAAGKGAPMACAMVYWGKWPERFSNEFRKYGAVVRLENAALPDDLSRKPELTLVAATRKTG